MGDNYYSIIKRTLKKTIRNQYSFDKKVKYRFHIMSKFRNKYRVESHRRPDWDYAGNGMYYLTVVTQNRICLFGKIKKNRIVLSEIGKIANAEWYKSFEIRKELFLNEFILMPNHLHAIVIIKKPDLLIGPNLTETHGPNHVEAHGPNHVEAHGRAPLQGDITDNPKNYLTRKPKSISSFMAGYKSAVTTQVNNWIDDNPNKKSIKYNRNNRLWQVNYHDRIIRNQNEYLRIKKYIRQNPMNWNKDRIN